MRTLIITLIGLISVTGFSQTDSDLLNEYLLTSSEATTLNSIYSNEREDFNFNGKLIGFTIGSTGTHIENKKVFFEKYINPLVDGQNKNVCSLIVLTKDEKSKSGGFDAVIMSPAKIFTKEQREKLIIGLAEIAKSPGEREKDELIESQK